MIQGHSIDALLSPDYYNPNSSLFQIWQFGRGLTAPIFLFGSGFAYVIASSRKSIGGKLPVSVFLKRLRWIGVLFFIGAVMHFPAPTLATLKAATPDQWEMFFHVDVLRLMSITLLALLLLLVFIRTRKSLQIACIFSTLAILLLTPILHLISWTHIVPESVSGFLSFESGSFFPFFPFGAYLFAGAAAATYYLKWKEQGKDSYLVPMFLVTGLSFLIIAFTLQMISFFGKLPVQSTPSLFFARTGNVLLLWAFFGFVIRKVRTLPSILPIAGQHTLLIYVTHIVLLYGSAWTFGLRNVFGKELTLLPVLIVVLSLLIFSTFLARQVHTVKITKAHTYRLIPYAGIALFAFIVILF